MDKSLYTRPNKARTMLVKNRRRAPTQALPELPPIVAIHRDSECHVTPENAANTMVEALEAATDDNVLEPQAGTGNLVKTLLDYGHSPSLITMVERSYQLCEGLKMRFDIALVPYPINECFLEYVTASRNTVGYSRIISNPPLSKTKLHIGKALDLLMASVNGNTILVTGLIEFLPNDTFTTTAVHTKLIRIVRQWTSFKTMLG